MKIRVGMKLRNSALRDFKNLADFLESQILMIIKNDNHFFFFRKLVYRLNNDFSDFLALNLNIRIQTLRRLNAVAD